MEPKMVLLWHHCENPPFGTFIFLRVYNGNQCGPMRMLFWTSLTKKIFYYFLECFAFILIAQLSNCNCEIQTCNSDFFLAIASLHLTIPTFSKLHDINVQFSLFFLKIVRYKLSIVSYKAQFWGKKYWQFSYNCKFISHNSGLTKILL